MAQRTDSGAAHERQRRLSNSHKLGIVNFGCGSEPAEGCINIDGSITVLLARLPLPARFFGGRAAFVGAIRDLGIRYGKANRLEFPESSLEGFYTSHTLEHLSRVECEQLLLKVRRWLKSTGVLRVALPDLRRLADGYVSGNIDADQFIDKTYLASGTNWLSTAAGHRDHRWMYDAASFKALLRRIGYSNIEDSGYGNSRLSELGSLDLESRKHESFYVEAGK